jgi:cytochrome c-type biogenesis protein CcmH/NrfF
MRSALVLLAVLFCAAPAVAEAPAPDERWAYDLAHELMSPYCPGRALAECPSPQADQLRMWIIAQARAGKTRDQVQAELAANFGDQIRQAPRAEGIGLVAYAVPAAFVVVGAALLAVFLRRSGSPA